MGSILCMQGTQYAPRESILCMEHFVALQGCRATPHYYLLSSTTVRQGYLVGILPQILHAVQGFEFWKAKSPAIPPPRGGAGYKWLVH